MSEIDYQTHIRNDILEFIANTKGFNFNHGFAAAMSCVFDMLIESYKTQNFLLILENINVISDFCQKNLDSISSTNLPENIEKIAKAILHRPHNLSHMINFAKHIHKMKIDNSSSLSYSYVIDLIKDLSSCFDFIDSKSFIIIFDKFLRECASGEYIFYPIQNSINFINHMKDRKNYALSMSEPEQ